MIKHIKWNPTKWIGYDNSRKAPFAAPQMRAVKVVDEAIRKMIGTSS